MSDVHCCSTAQEKKCCEAGCKGGCKCPNCECKNKASCCNNQQCCDAGCKGANCDCKNCSCKDKSCCQK